MLYELVKQQTGQAAVDMRFIGGGSFGKVFKAVLSGGATLALKAYRRQGDQAEEAYQLGILAANTNVKMPEVVFTYADEKTAVMAMSFIDGSNALNPAFLLCTKEQKSAFATAVVDGMSRWHTVKNSSFGDLKNPHYSSWAEYYKTEKQQPWLSSLQTLVNSGKFSSRKYELLCTATELFNKVCEEPESAVLIHGDLNIMNIMSQPKTMKLTGFIDPSGSMWADREYDLFQLRNMWGDSFGLYETYKNVHTLSPYADFRVAYYAAMHEASMRLNGGLHTPLWEDLNNRRLVKEMKKLK